MTDEKLVVEGLSLTRGSGTGRGGSGRPVLQDVSFRVRCGEVFGVIGPSGAGKTTLLRLLNGLESPERGRILIDGADVSASDVLDLRRRVGMVFQVPALFPGRVCDNVGAALSIRGVRQEEQACRGRAMLERVGLAGEFWERAAAELSQGEQQRVSIARALVSEPELLLMDEPTSALDPTASMRILSLVRSLNREFGVTIVFVTHLMEQARGVCDRALVLIEGRGVEEGAVPGLFEAPTSELTRRFIEGDLKPERGLAEPRSRECTTDGGGAV